MISHFSPEEAYQEGRLAAMREFAKLLEKKRISHWDVNEAQEYYITGQIQDMLTKIIVKESRKQFT